VFSGELAIELRLDDGCLSDELNGVSAIQLLQGE